MLPLTGFTVTAARHADKLATLLKQREAAVRAALAIKTAPLPDDHELLRATKACLTEPPDTTVTTGIGFRR